MSRRRSTGRLTRQPARWVTYDETPAYETDGSGALDVEPTVHHRTRWWYATRMPEPWDYYLWHQWPSAWADVTLTVCDVAWRRYGARYYAAQKDTELRDDLRSWLVVEAITTAADFVPNPWYANPEGQWAAFLHGSFRRKARWHFASVMGDAGTDRGNTNREVLARGIVSTDYLDEMEGAEHGFRVNRHPLVGEDLLLGNDPANVLIRLEDLARQVEDIEREDRRAGNYRTSGAPETCLINLCTRPPRGRGLCAAHYEQERDRAIGRGDWSPARANTQCEVEGCEREPKGRMCPMHDQRLRRTGITDAPVFGGTCKADDCERPIKAQGLCTMHHSRLLRTGTLELTNQRQIGPCDAEDCDQPKHSRGLCNYHYNKTKVRLCTEQGCTTQARVGTLCKKHHTQQQAEAATP